MTDEVKVLTGRTAIPAGISPTGVKYKAFRLGEHPLFEIHAVRHDEEEKEHPDLTRNKLIAGSFTSEAKAMEALRKVLTVLWAESDAVAAKNERPRKGTADAKLDKAA